MLKTAIKKLVLYFKNKKRKVTSFTSFIAVKANIGQNTIICRNTEIDGYCTIGKYVYIGINCSVTKTDIGNYCSIANNVLIGQGDHNLYNVSTSSLFYNNSYLELTQKDCSIGNDVWIGASAIILRGVTIGDGAVIGANSVVTKDIPPYAVAVGSPANVIKYRFSEKKIEAIRDTKWWNYDLESAKKLIKDFDVNCKN